MDELELHELIDNKQRVKIIQMYRDLYQNGDEPHAKDFLYHEDEELQKAAMTVMIDTDAELSQNWKKFYDGHISSREELYKEEVSSTLNYLQLRKIKRLIIENQQEFEKSTDPEQQLVFMQTHQLLKKMEAEVSKLAGTVIYK